MSVRSVLMVSGALMIWPGHARAQDAQSAQDTSAQTSQTATDPASDTTTTVVINGKKKAVAKTLDKTVYSTADNPKADSGTAQDVLQSTPTLSVTANGDISVNGNRNVTVLINGKPSAPLTGDSRAVTLQTMAGSDIASVEVITNPSAAYNANGGAIVNIVLKKDRKPGGHGSLRANASDQGLWNINTSGDYTQNKLSVHGSVAVRRDASLKFRQSDVAWHDPQSGDFGDNYAASKVFIRRTTQNATLGVDYDLNDQDSLGASATYNFRRSRPWFDEFHRDDHAGQLIDIYHHISNGPNEQSDDSISLNYNHTKDDIGLKLGLQHSDTDTLVDKSAVSTYIYPVQPNAFDHISNGTRLHIDQANLDYARPLGAMAQVSLGLYYEKTATGIDNYFAAVDPATGTETIDANITHRYQVTATQRAAYVTVQATWDKWQALAGARFEVASTHLAAEHQMTVPDSHYQSLNPSLHLKYSADAHDSVTLSYSQSLQRPDPDDLNPYITYWDPQNLFTGNPNLKPQALRSVELIYDGDRKTLNFSLGGFYRTSRHTVVDYRSFIDDDILLTTRRNGGSGLSTGLTGSVDWTPLPAWHVTADASTYYVELTSLDLEGPVKQVGLSGSANLSLDYKHGADDVAFDAHLQGPGLTPQGQYSATNTLNLVWKRQLSKRLTFNLSLNDLLDGSKQSYSTTTSTFYQRGYNHFDVRRVYVGLVYSLG